jgi:hypothetical protein
MINYVIFRFMKGFFYVTFITNRRQCFLYKLNIFIGDEFVAIKNKTLWKNTKCNYLSARFHHYSVKSNG